MSQCSRKRTAKAVVSALLFTLLSAAMSVAHAADRPSFRVAWSIYVGWMPWDYAERTGILGKWADKYDIDIELVQMNDYIESINQYTAGQFDAVTATNMDILTIAAASGVDSTALIVGDYSNGNDGIVLGKGRTLADIRGERVHLVELSVSHYLLARALSTVGLSERDVTVVNMAEADLVAGWASGSVPAVVTWNPMLMQLRDRADTATVFDSSSTPGEILDLTVIKTEVMQAHPALAKALTGAWYETIAVLADPERREAAQSFMATASGTDLQSFQRQLETTYLFQQPDEAVSFVQSRKPREIMEKVAEFSWEKGLYGPMAPDAGFVGIEFADGSVWGNGANVQLRFTDEFMRMAATDAL